MPDESLTPQESLDSDEVRNDDGDEVVDPPEDWVEPREDESLDQRLADEDPDVSADAPASDEGKVQGVRAHRGQLGGTPEDGDSFFPVVD